MASRSLGTLYVDFMAKTSGLETDMGRASRIAKQRAKEIDKSIAATMRSVERSAKAIGVGVAVAVGAAAVAIKRSIDEMDQIGQTAQKIGVTTEALSALQYAAKLADVDAGALQASLTKLAKTQADAAQGGKKQIEVFRLLDIEFKNADGTLRKADDVFTDVAQRFSEMEDGAGKTALAVQVFGRSGANLIPLLNEGAAGLRKAREEAEAFGIIVSGEAAKAANEFNDNLDRMANAMAGPVMQAATELLPVLNDLTNEIITAAKDPAFRADFANAIETMGTAAITAAKGIVTFTNNIGFLADEVKQFFGVIDENDVERLIQSRDKLQKKLSTLQTFTFPGVDNDISRTAERVFAEIKVLDAKIAAAQSIIAARVKSEQLGAGLDEIDLSGIPRRKLGAAPVFTDISAATEAEKDREKAITEVSRLALDATSDEAKAVEELRQQYLKLDEAVKSGAVSAQKAAEIRTGLAAQALKPLQDASLTDEARAVQELQLSYTKLDNLVSAGAITRAKADEIGARFAEQWRDSEEEKIYQFRVSNGLVGEQEQALHALRNEMEAIQRVSDASAGGLPGGIAGFSQAQADALKAEAQAKFDAMQAQANRDEVSSLGSGLLQQGEYDLSPLEQSLRAQEDMIEESYARRMADILASTTATDEQQTDLMIRAAEQRNAALQDLDTQRSQGQLALWGEAFGNLATLMQSENSKLFAIGKAAAIAEAIVNIAVGITKALALGPIVGPVLAATVAAAGGVQIATIAAQQPAAYDKGGEIKEGAIGLVGERGIEVVHASNEAMLITKPTLIEGPAHVTGRVATAKLLREEPLAFAGMFDAGGFIPPGQVGMVGERRSELVNASRLTRAPSVSMQHEEKSAAAEQLRLRQVIVFGDDAIEGAMGSEAGERVFITHAERNRAKLRSLLR